MNKDDLNGLGVSLAGLTMRTPIGVGPVGSLMISPGYLTPERYAETLLRDVEAGAGHICLPTFYIPAELAKELQKRSRPIQPPSTPLIKKLMSIKTPGLGVEGIYNLSSGSAATAEHRVKRFEQETLKIIQILRERRPQDVPIMANVHGGAAFPEGFVASSKRVEDAGVDLIELNMSGAVAASIEGVVEGFLDGKFPFTHLGPALGDQPELVANITREVVKAVKIPVGVKISPETGYPRVIALAQKIRDAGAKFVTVFNQGVSIAPPDIYNRGRSTWPYLADNPFCGASGSWLRPILYKQVAAIAKYVPEIQIVAVGGLVAPAHTVEVMMLGAKAVQLCTGIIYQGRKLIKKNIQFLNRYMKEQGYQSLEEVIGLGVNYIKPINMVSPQEQLLAEVDDMKCTGCGICADSFCLACYIADRKAKVRVEECIGCGLCVAACPLGAMSLRKRS